MNNIIRRMDFYQHTENWFKGEIFEGMMILVFGIIILFLSAILWKYSITPNGKSLVIPLFVVGLFFVIGISVGFISNNKRMEKFEKRYSENSLQFIEQEKIRVEDFQKMYTQSTLFSGLIFLTTILVFLYSDSKLFQSIMISLILVGTSLIVIDFFQKKDLRF